MQSQLTKRALSIAGPVLDEATFQKMLEAVFVLQQESELRREIDAQSRASRFISAKPDLAASTSLTDYSQTIAQAQTLRLAPEPEWRYILAAERASMLEVLERIKPQLERLARAASA